MSSDYYKVLGVSKTVTEKEIKTAYRQLAIQWHPDKHPGDVQAEERFKEINRAYETLRDPARRAEYDQELSGPATRPVSTPGPSAGKGTAGSTPTGRRAPAGGAGTGQFNDLLGAMFGGAAGRAGAAGRPPPTRGTEATGGQGSTSDIRLEITLEEAYLGSQRKQKVNTEVSCPDCRGTGNSQAGRSGLQMGSMCLTCRGAGRKHQIEEVPVNIPAGIYEGAKLRVKGKGPLDLRGQRSDLIFNVHIKKHDRFEVDGNDLILDLAIPYTVLVLGGEVQVPTMGGNKTLRIAAGTQIGQKIRMSGSGLPGLGTRATGDLDVRVKVAIPKEIGSDERQLLISLARLRKDPISAS